jgi:polysaccharide pyruvyl transferase WcaK-like protein
MIVVHIAWLGHKNFGDDVMAEALRRFMSEMYGDVKYYVVCEGSVEKKQGVSPFYPLRRKYIFLGYIFEYFILRKTDVLILGGGSVLHSENSITWKKRLVEKYREVSKKKTRVFGISLGLGPFKTERAKKKCRELLNSLDVASFRDKPSFLFAKKCMKKGVALHSFDVSATYCDMFGVKQRESVSEIHTIGVVLKKGSGSHSLRQKHKELIIKLSKKYDYVRVFAFCTSEKFGEGEYIKQILYELSLSNVLFIPYLGDCFQFLQSLRSCDFIISVRLHGLIISYLLNIPFYALSYHKKCDDFLSEVGVSPRFQQDSEYFNVARVLSGVMPYSLKRSNLILKKSWVNFDIFD